MAIDKQAMELLRLIFEEIRGTVRTFKSKNVNFQGKNETLKSEN